nr:alpha/beta hydrolase [Thermodesulfobacteriota bacterium]
LELDTIIPVCYSIPCKVGVKYFNKYPDQVAKLVLAAGNPTLTRSVNQADLISFIENDYENAMDYYMKRCFSDSEGNTDWQLDLMMTVALKSNSFVATSILKNYYKDDIEPLLPRIDIPTLIIHGDKDVVYPVERAYRFKELVPGSILHVHKDKGHLPHLTDTVNFNTTVEEFLLK